MLAMCCEAAAVAAAELAVLPGSGAGLVDRRGGGGGGVSSVEGKRQLAPPPVEAPDALSNSSRILVGCDLRLLDILQESWSMYLVSPKCCVFPRLGHFSQFTQPFQTLAD